MTEKKKTLQVNCPECGESVQWTEKQTHRPFCSLRCKQKDFCEWADESKVIPGNSIYDDVLSDDLNE